MLTAFREVDTMCVHGCIALIGDATDLNILSNHGSLHGENFRQEHPVVMFGNNGRPEFKPQYSRPLKVAE